MGVFGEIAVGDWGKLLERIPRVLWKTEEGVTSLLVSGILINEVDVNDIFGGSENVG